ncbi:hypothetical protein BDV96DRAFT_596352 [Lophiotrema nucula]|uniref:Carboxylesterase type B domain-containing protein n=1 Tax=Lophiotrema nucula TaxID=690887 RepID=A0A6A5ZKI1_9PLEO|nr:hypothetical protein BDV96DRAFT_596352 [Lophiotrema nucula]
MGFGTRGASYFGHAYYGSMNQPNASEDCLTLNIWRPNSASGAEERKYWSNISRGKGKGSLAVFVWFYGGGLSSGYTRESVIIPHFSGIQVLGYGSNSLIRATMDLLVFLNGKQMAELGLLNIDMLDERLALHWIQENIASFGGDLTKGRRLIVQVGQHSIVGLSGTSPEPQPPILDINTNGKRMKTALRHSTPGHITTRGQITSTKAAVNC